MVATSALPVVKRVRSSGALTIMTVLIFGAGIDPSTRYRADNTLHQRDRRLPYYHEAPKAPKAP